MKNCNHLLKTGTICNVDKDGNILCPICGFPIRSQVRSELDEITDIDWVEDGYPPTNI